MKVKKKNTERRYSNDNCKGIQQWYWYLSLLIYEKLNRRCSNSQYNSQLMPYCHKRAHSWRFLQISIQIIKKNSEFTLILSAKEEVKICKLNI